jgi:glycosyltransferase involved in cell wall biosynthesis
LKILHAVHNYPPEFRGGIERVVESLVAEQVAAGQGVAVMAGSETTATSAEARLESHEGVLVHRLVRGAGIRDSVDPFRADLAVAVDRTLAAIAPDVLHVHHWFNLGGDLVRRAARRGIPSVVTLHDSYATCGLFFRLPDGATPCDLPQGESTCIPCIGSRFGVDGDEIGFRVAMRAEGFAAELLAATAVTAPSASHARALAPHVPPAVKIEVVAPGSPAVAPVDPSPRTGPLRVLHFGNLCRLKGVDLLIRAAAAADPSGKMIRVTLAGPLVDAELPTGQAVMAGPFDAARLRALAADADVAAFPSFARESYGLVVDEAMRLGLPVLVSDRGALAERIRGRGVALPAGDVRAWSDALARLSRDPAQATRMREAPPAPLATPADHARAMLALYERARGAKLPAVDLETPVLRRLAHFETRLGDFIHALAQRKEPG